MFTTRRDFLKTSLGTSALCSLGPAVPAFLSRSALAAAPRQDDGHTILVVVQMAGGNDGLNTVVPYEDDEYARRRPTLRWAAKEVHKIDSLLGFHPRMQAFMRLYQEGHLSIVQGVGYPNPNGDHAAAMRDWQTARPHQPDCQTGWLGRAIDHACHPGEANTPGVFVGQIAQPFGLNTEKAVVPSIKNLEQCMLTPEFDSAGPAQRTRTGDDNPLLDFLRLSARTAHADSRRIEAAANAPTAEYPPLPLAQSLKTVAQLIRAELGIRIFHTELGGNGPGGFDNHANQRGNHGALLSQLSESVAAFVDDLKRDKLLDRVLLITFSEFGRTVAENGRHGTGHGSAAPVFLAGGRLKGRLIGAHPALTELENGGQKFHTDFRRVYATVLDRWLGMDSSAILGEKFDTLDVLEA
ncbi:MAG TPA: DUF1501 domain-containing protein [Thermoguttaceae bacterium]|nr:DUF1501 domain-containing protein [Thermoguttaceae bacterium]